VTIRVPKYSVENARKGLKMRKQYKESDRPVLSVREANRKGVNSGVTTARTLINGYENDKALSRDMAKRILSFLQRNMGQYEYAESQGWNTDKIVTARMVWGGSMDERFMEYLRRKL